VEVFFALESEGFSALLCLSMTDVGSFLVQLSFAMCVGN